MSDLYLNQHDADQQIIDNLLRQLRRIKPMVKYFKDTDGQVYKSTAHELVQATELQAAQESLNSELGNITALLEEPQIKSSIIKAEEDAAATEAYHASISKPVEAPAANPSPEPAPAAPVEQPVEQASAELSVEAPAAPAPEQPAPVATEAPAPAEAPAPITLQ